MSHNWRSYSPNIKISEANPNKTIDKAEEIMRRLVKSGKNEGAKIIPSTLSNIYVESRCLAPIFSNRRNVEIYFVQQNK